MVLRAIILSGLLLLLVEHPNSAQVYAQGQNINKMNVFTLNVTLERQSNGFYLARLDFRGRRKDVDWYIKEGAVHKSFAGEEDMIGYLGKNGWVFMEKQEIKSKSGEPLGDNYVFRKSMEQLSEEENQEKQ
jgi:hypothetical protein